MNDDSWRLENAEQIRRRLDESAALQERQRQAEAERAEQLRREAAYQDDYEQAVNDRERMRAHRLNWLERCVHHLFKPQPRARR